MIKKLSEKEKIKAAINMAKHFNFKSHTPQFTIYKDKTYTIHKIENKTDILFHGVWIQVILNPRLKRSKYDNKLKIIYLRENKISEILHELTHALHYIKHDLIVKKLSQSTRKGNTNSEYLALFVEVYAKDLLDWSERINTILR